MKGIWIIGALLVSNSALASPKVGRHLPRGEEHPAMIESLYESPFGEVQFTRIGTAGGHSGFLRNNKGYLIGFKEVRGHAACEAWFLSDKETALPGDCEFVFNDELTGRDTLVRSGEMTETSIFSTTKGKMRDLAPSLKTANRALSTEHGGTDESL